MQTQSHFLITALGADTYKQNSSIPLHARALLVGSVLPDLPFWLLTIFGELYFLYVAPLPGVGRGATAMQIMEYLHFDRFFKDPLWIISHNFFSLADYQHAADGDWLVALAKWQTVGPDALLAGD